MEQESIPGELSLDDAPMHTAVSEDNDAQPSGEVYDTMELTDLQESPSQILHVAEDHDHDVASFLRSAGVDVSQDHHAVDLGMGMEEDLSMGIGLDDHRSVEGMAHLDLHELRPDGDHELLHNDDAEAPTFDLHQIHQELDASSSIPHNHHETVNGHAQADYDDGPNFSDRIDGPDFSDRIETTSHDIHTGSFSDLNLAPAPGGRMSQAGPPSEETPIPTGVQIVNEEVLINDVGLVPMSEEVSFTPIPRGQSEGCDDKELSHQEDRPHGSGPVAAAMVQTPPAGNPPLPIDHALTEPITAFYKLQFLEAPPAQTSGPHGEYRPKEAFSYYMQTLDVTIGRKVNRLKRAGTKQQERRTSTGIKVDSGEGDTKKMDIQGSDIQEQEHNEKVNSAMSFHDDAIISKNIEGEDASEQGKRSAPPEVPPAKEIAKPPIENDVQEPSVSRKVSDHGLVKQEEELPVVKQEHELDGEMEGRGQTQVEDEDERQVDVDLGALKSVSRLHARIGYSYTLSQFYLDVLGRNGAWVDDVFKVKGSRVALGPYTKIQISTRTFYFILPPASIASYPIPFNQNAVPGPSASSLPFGNANTASVSQQATPDNEKDLHHLIRQPATFNAFSTNREEWEDERMGLFGMGAGMGKNGGYGYRSRHRKGRKCKKCRLHEFQHNGGDDDEEADHQFSASDNDAVMSEENSVCSCSRCASEKQWMSSSPESGVEYSSSLSSVSDSEDSSSDEEESDEEGDEEDEDDDEEEAEEDDEEEAAAKHKKDEIEKDDQGIAVETNETPKAEEVNVDVDEKVVQDSTHIDTTVVREGISANSDEESEEETLASKLKVDESLKPTSLSTPHLDDFNDEASPGMQVDDLPPPDSHVFPPTEADIQAVQDLIASSMAPMGEEAAPLQIPGSSNGVPFGNGIFSSMDNSLTHGDGDGMEPVPEIKLTKAEKSALAARIREAKAAARKEEQERKKAEKLAQKEKEKAEKAKAKADAAAAKAAKKQKAEALERERMLAKMESLQNTHTDQYSISGHDSSGAGIAGNTASTSGAAFPPSIRPGMPRPMHTGHGQIDIRPALRPGMPGVRPPRPMANGFRPINSAANAPAAGAMIRPPRPGAQGIAMRPGMQGIRPGPAGGSLMRPGPGSVPPIQAQMPPGMPMRPLPPGMRPVRPGQPMRPLARPPQPQQRPPLQPHMNPGSYHASQDGFRMMSPDRTPTRATSVLSQDAPSRSPSLDPSSQKRTTPLLGVDGQPFIGPEPIKPDLTYATIIYRALAGVDRGRGTLGQVCDWVANEWEWFRMNPESGWQNSIRHNLSLNKAFLKVPRVPEDDPESKGSVWILDPVHAPELVERERKAAEQKEARLRREAEKAVTFSKIAKPKKPADKLYRRDSETDQYKPAASAGGGNAPAYGVESVLSGLIPPLLVPLNRQIPLMLGAIPPHLKSVDIKLKHLLPEPPYVYDNNNIILNPIVFGRFSKQQLAQMQALPTKSAIQVLRTYVLRWLQEKVKKLGPSSLPRTGSPATRPVATAATAAPRPSGALPVRPVSGTAAPRPRGIRPVPGQVRPLQPGPRPALARPGAVVRPLVNGAPIRPGMRPTGVPGGQGVRPAPRPVNGGVNVSRPPQPTPALDPETLRKITQLAESAIKTNSAQSANAKVLLQYLKQVGSQVNIGIATQILSTGVIPPNAIPVRTAPSATNSGTSPSVRPPISRPSTMASQHPSSVLGKRPADSTSAAITDSNEAKRQKV